MKEPGRSRGAPVWLIRRITLTTAVPALVLSAFGRVVYWKSDAVAERLLQRFEHIDPNQLVTTGEWCSVLESAFDCWADHAETASRLSMDRSLGGIRVDLSGCLLQLIAMNLEEEFVFRDLAARWLAERSDCGRARYVDDGTIGRLRTIGCDLTEYGNAPTVYGMIPWTSTLAWFRALAVTVRAIQSVLRTSPASTNRNERYDYVFGGISSHEFAVGPDQLDFTFLIRRRLVDPARCIFVLSSPPQPDCIKWLSDHKANWVWRRALGALLPAGDRIRIALSIATETVRVPAMRIGRGYGAIVLELRARARTWASVAKRLDPAALVTSFSSSWPEPPETAVMNALGKRTVSWHYGANMFEFPGRQEAVGFRDRKVYNSVTVAREVWAWGPETRDLVADRQVLGKKASPRFRLSGAVMQGDSRWLQLSPTAAREKFGLVDDAQSLFLGVFDVAAKSDAERRAIGIGPVIYTDRMQNRFFEDLAAALNAIPTLHLIVKPKRKLGDRLHTTSDAMMRLIDPEGLPVREGRVTLLPYNVDPYIPVALSDCCIGMPFTSPVLVGLSSGRNGIYYDPLNQATGYRPQRMESLMIRNSEILIKTLTAWRTGSGQRAVHRELFLPPCEPGENFVAMLENACDG